MTSKPTPIKTIIAITCIFFGIASSTHSAAEIELLTKYFDFLTGGNFESAAYLWDEASLDRASRFGIEYTDIPLKVDCGSPIVRNLPLMRNFLQPPARISERLTPAEYMRLEYSHVINSQEVKHDYFVRNDGAYYWFIYPQDYYCRDYKSVTSKYFRVHYAPESKPYLHSTTLTEADNFVVRMADSLHLSPEALSLLELKKLDYYYIASDSLVKTITGFAVQGTYDLASDDIISATFPHYHELSHFLVHYSLKSLPLYTLPIFREGIAVHYGGRWGKAAAPLEQLGKFLLGQQIVEVDSILTMTGFESLAGSDIAYPLAGLFCSYILDTYGPAKFWELYRDCSGNIDSLSALTPEAIQGRILRAVGISEWSQMATDFAQFANGVGARSSFRPGIAEGGKAVTKVGDASITESGEWISIQFAATDSIGPVASLLIGKDKVLSKGKSSLFDTQFKDGTPFEGYRWGVRVDRNEAGIYDYAGNQLTAKYIYAMDPDSTYYSADGRTVQVKFHRSLIGGKVPSASDMKFLNK